MLDRATHGLTRVDCAASHMKREGGGGLLARALPDAAEDLDRLDTAGRPKEEEEEEEEADPACVLADRARGEGARQRRRHTVASNCRST